MTLGAYRMPGSSERGSRFRTKRISLNPYQVCAYYGICESDEEIEELMAPTTKQNRDSDQTTFVPPSFRCSLVASHFQSTGSEDASFDTQIEKLEIDIMDRTKVKQNPGSYHTTFVPPSFRCSLAASHFQSTVCEDASFDNQTESLESDIVERTKVEQNRDSDHTTFVPPSFWCSLAASHFQSTVCEDTSFANQSESLKNDIMERTKKYSDLSRTDGCSSSIQKENEGAQSPMNDDVIISDVESPPRQRNMARYSRIIPPPYRPGPVHTRAEPKPWRMDAKTLFPCPRIPRRTNEHSAEQRNSFDKLQPMEYTVGNSFASPVRTTKRQFERKMTSRLDNETNAFGAQMDSTILYGSQLESDDSLDSPKIKHIVIRASPKKKPREYVLAAPKIQRNNPDSPSIVEYGLRRSNRNRVRRLDPGHLQKPIYERDASGNETLVGVGIRVVHNNLLTKHKTADPQTAFEMERQMQQRKKLERGKKKDVKELLAKKYSRYK
ncbi:hypothetical protein DdX_16579 [Ditylenchus destructor]|uniref:Uncharacterized protein n=1 Tax=Ditylenchus destructor TaxID=166010 RepID=A0AAD4MN74_9BILA|nr:hypothetical protein DdX_16579 [Ditylenchus destructor]